MTVPTEETEVHGAIDQPLGALGERVTARIEEIRIQNFRALEDVRLRLQDLTFLVGRNGAGKSSILDAVEFMREAVTDSLPNALARRDGFAGVYRQQATVGKPLGIAVVMRIDLLGRLVRVLYGFRILPKGPELDLEERLSVAPETSLGFVRLGDEFRSGVLRSGPSLAADRLALPLIASDQLWGIVLERIAQMRSYAISPTAVAAPTPIMSSTNLAPNGSNAGDVLEEINRRPAASHRVVETLQAVLPGVLAARSDVSLGRRIISISQDLGDSQREFNAGQVSQGTLRSLGILLALHQQPQPSLVLIDEVEDSIHPRALQAIIEAAEVCTGRFPVVMTTHSPEVLSARQVTTDRLHIVQWDHGASNLYAVSEGTSESIDRVTTVGDLLRINALWPTESPERVHGDLLELEE